MRPQALQHELGKRQPFDSASQGAYLNLLRTAADLSGPFDRLFRAEGLSQSSYNALRILRGEGPCPCQRIAERLVVRVPDVTRLVDRLVSSGLAERHRSGEDRRVVLVSITDSGRTLLDRLDGPVRELHERQLAHMSRKDQEELSRLLELARTPTDEGDTS
ncbi:MAG: MarR family transcriptional regulator [Phycisphaerales bacterium]